jgi:hypothetical protein
MSSTDNILAFPMSYCDGYVLFITQNCILNPYAGAPPSAPPIAPGSQCDTCNSTSTLLIPTANASQTCPNGVNNTGGCCPDHSGPFLLAKNHTIIGMTSDTNGCGIFD